MLLAGMSCAVAADVASYPVDTEVKLLSDQRNNGMSDSGGKPGVQLSLQVGHESGLTGLAQLCTISKKAYPEGNGDLLLAGGWRSGDPDGFDFGLGLAGRQVIKNFSKANATSYTLGATTKQWGFDWGVDLITTRTKVREMYLLEDGKKILQLDKTGLVFSVARKF